MRRLWTGTIALAIIFCYAVLIIKAQDAPQANKAAPAPIATPTPSAQPILLTPEQRQAIANADQQIQIARANLQAAELAYQNAIQSAFIAGGGSKDTHEPRLVAFDQKGEQVGFPVKAAPVAPAKK